MSDIEKLLAEWQDGGYINPDALKAAYDAIILLLDRVKALEETINTLTS